MIGIQSYYPERILLNKIDISKDNKYIFINVNENDNDIYVYLKNSAKHFTFEEFYEILYEAINKTL